MVSSADLRLYDFIRDFISSHDYAPSIREMVSGCDFGSTSTASYHLGRLRIAGLVDFADGIARSVRIVGVTA